jgi:hypothetical protein
LCCTDKSSAITEVFFVWLKNSMYRCFKRVTWELTVLDLYA